MEAGIAFPVRVRVAPTWLQQCGFATLSEVAAALPSVPLGGLEAAAMEFDPEQTPALKLLPLQRPRAWSRKARLLLSKSHQPGGAC